MIPAKIQRIVLSYPPMEFRKPYREGGHDLPPALALTSVATQHSGCIEQDLVQIVEVDIS